MTSSPGFLSGFFPQTKSEMSETRRNKTENKNHRRAKFLFLCLDSGDLGQKTLSFFRRFSNPGWMRRETGVCCKPASGFMKVSVLQSSQTLLLDRCNTWFNEASPLFMNVPLTLHISSFDQVCLYLMGISVLNFTFFLFCLSLHF